MYNECNIFNIVEFSLVGRGSFSSLEFSRQIYVFPSCFSISQLFYVYSRRQEVCFYFFSQHIKRPFSQRDSYGATTSVQRISMNFF